MGEVIAHITWRPILAHGCFCPTSSLQIVSSPDRTPSRGKWSGQAHFEPFLVFFFFCWISMSCEFEIWITCTWITDIICMLYIPCLGFFGAQILLNEEGRFRPWPLHRQLHWRARSQDVRQICELRAISWVLTCRTNTLHCHRLSQCCIHMHHLEQCNTISVLYYD